MNSKKAKLLRKMAGQMASAKAQGEKKEIPPRSLKVLKQHEARAQAGSFDHVTAVNDPLSVRGIYRWLKGNFDVT
jgi:hypothetical protein